MLWFRNAIIYQMNKDSRLDKESIEQAVKAYTFIPCGSFDSTKFGWVSPYGDDNDTLMVDMQGQLLLRMKKESKILPNSVVKQTLLDKIAQQENALQKKLSKAEKLSLKDEVMVDLIPRAFSKYNYSWLWIDTVNKRLIVDSSSFKQAEDILAILRKELGTLAIVPLSIDKPLEQIMTTWVEQKLHYSPMELGDEAELKDPLEGSGVIRCKNQEIISDEIKIHLDAGKQVTKMKLIDERGINFILNKDFTFKRIKFDSAILDKNEDFSIEELDKKLEADFLIMANTLAEMVESLLIIVNKIT